MNAETKEQALSWFFIKDELGKNELKEKYFPTTPIQYSLKWGFHFTLGQIYEMYEKELQAQADTIKSLQDNKSDHEPETN